MLAAQGLAAVTAPFIIVWFYGPQFRAAVPIAFVLVVSEVFLGIALLEYRILAAKERTRSLVLISVSMLVTAVILYTVGAPGRRSATGHRGDDSVGTLRRCVGHRPAPVRA